MSSAEELSSKRKKSTVGAVEYASFCRFVPINYRRYMSTAISSEQETLQVRLSIERVSLEDSAFLYERLS